MSKPNIALKFRCGISMKNKFMLAPMTNQQSHDDGRMSDEELHWLTMRAKGQFGMIMTCASHIQENGKGFAGQLGIFSDIQNSGHQRLTNNLKAHGCISIIQLYHGGMRSPKALINETPLCPSDNEEFGARSMTLNEIAELKENFKLAAIRAQQCNYDGVEIHGAHGYLICQFLSSEINQRTDQYGGSLENRTRLLNEIIQEIRNSCGPNFLIGVRLSPERYGMDLDEIKSICVTLAKNKKVDFLDISLWDSFKLPKNSKYQNLSLLDHFTSLDLGDTKLTVAGKIRNGKDVNAILNAGVDFVTIGQAGILHHDFPLKVFKNPNFESTSTPISQNYLLNEGVSTKFIDYLRKRPGFVENS